MSYHDMEPASWDDTSASPRDIEAIWSGGRSRSHSQTALQHVRGHLKICLVAACLLATLFFLLKSPVRQPHLDHGPSAFGLNLTSPPSLFDLLDPPFGLSEIAVILKTGASVIQDRAGVRFEKELADLPFPLQIYSDYEETFRGHQVLDILKDLPEVVQKQADFLPYFVQKKRMDRGVTERHLQRAWNLDKYQFIPMIGDTYRRFSVSTKFYVYMEADTYLFLPNLLRWLATRDPSSQGSYGTGNIPCGSVNFAHGGSGMVFTQGLLDASYGTHWDHALNVKTDALGNACCGDMVLAQAMLETPGITVLRPDPDTFDLFSGATPTPLRFGANNGCSPIFSFHHIAQNDYIRRFDIFSHWVLPELQEALATLNKSLKMHNWDNRGVTELPPPVFQRKTKPTAKRDVSETQIAGSGRFNETAATKTGAGCKRPSGGSAVQTQTLFLGGGWIASKP